MSLRRVLPLTAVLLAAAPGAAHADEAVGDSARGTTITADAGYAAWRADDGHVVLRAGDRAPVRTNVVVPDGPFDVGPAAGGGAQLVHATYCSTDRGTCVVRAAALRSGGRLSARTVAHIPYRGGGVPAVAADGSRLVYAVHGTTGSGRARSACDVPYVRDLRHGAPRRLDRGHCARIAQLDAGEGHVAVLAEPAVRYGSGATEARVVRLGGGPSHTLQREAQGEESNFIGAVALDRGALYTARGGIRQADVFTRFDLGSRARSDARAFVTLAGPFSRDRGRTTYLQVTAFEGAGECDGGRDTPGCVVVAGQDPFGAATRALVPQLELTVAPQPVFVDSAPAAVAALTRRTVSRTAVVGGPAPVSGVPVELLAATPAGREAVEPAPTGATATTGADGTARIPLPGGPQPQRLLAARTRPAAALGVPVPSGGSVFVQTYVHLTATAQRLADGRLQLSGTISPAQPGRRVRLDRRLDRTCNPGIRPGGVVRPQQTGVPAGCFDRYTQDPVATAAVSPDGASYSLTAPGSAPAGTYSVSLDFAGGAPVYAGQTPGVPAP